MAAVWGYEARHGLRQPQLPWSPYEAGTMTAADGTHEEPLPTTDQHEEKE